jgi:hypothetical protein
MTTDTGQLNTGAALGVIVILWEQSSAELAPCMSVALYVTTMATVPDVSTCAPTVVSMPTVPDVSTWVFIWTGPPSSLRTAASGS